MKKEKIDILLMLAGCLQVLTEGIDELKETSFFKGKIKFLAKNLLTELESRLTQLYKSTGKEDEIEFFKSARTVKIFLSACKKMGFPFIYELMKQVAEGKVTYLPDEKPEQ